MEKTLKEQQFEGLKSADEYIVKLIKGINMFIKDMEEVGYSKSSDLLSYIIEGIEWLNEVVRLTKDIQKENMDEMMMKENIEKITKYVDIKDYNRVLEVLQIEVLPKLTCWQYIIKASIK